jgi:hypothetical protein
MKKINRRKFIYSTAMIAAIPGVVSTFGSETTEKIKGPSNNILLGVISSANNPEEDLKIVRDLGFPTCQLGVDNYSPELALRVSASLKKYGLKATTLICMGPGLYK